MIGLILVVDALTFRQFALVIIKSLGQSLFVLTKVDLIEKTNREGFIENDAYELFVMQFC